jgi:hypothetical protein
VASLRKLSLVALVAGMLVAQPALAQAPSIAAAHHPSVGIADENYELFSDPRFLALGITEVRFYVSWDVLSKAYKNHYRRDELAAWLGQAHALHLTPLITFDHSDRKGQAGHLPSVAQFSQAFRAFRKAYPWVTEYATWNEANYYGEPTARNPKRVAGYYLALRHDCPKCTILAAELLDIGSRSQAVNEVTWAREFIHYAHRQPAYWGMHNYVSANTLSETSVKQVLRAVTGNIWLTETGGIVALPHHGRSAFPLTTAHQAKVDNFLLNKLPKLSGRIQRIYLYEWRALKKKASWDSALIAYNDQPRKAYTVLADALANWGIAPNCTLAKRPPTCSGVVGATGPTGPTSSGVAGATGPTSS